MLNLYDENAREYALESDAGAIEHIPVKSSAYISPYKFNIFNAIYSSLPYPNEKLDLMI